MQLHHRIFFYWIPSQSYQSILLASLTVHWYLTIRLQAAPELVGKVLKIGWSNLINFRSNTFFTCWHVLHASSPPPVSVGALHAKLVRVNSFDTQHWNGEREGKIRGKLVTFQTLLAMAVKRQCETKFLQLGNNIPQQTKGSNNPTSNRKSYVFTN